MSTDAKSLSQMSPAEKRAFLAELLRTQASRPQDLPLSFAQQRLWFLDRLHPGTPLYNIPAAVRLRMPIQRQALARSIDEIVRRHASLRTTFREVNGEPRQVITPHCPIELAVADIGSLPDTVRDAEVLRLAATEAQRGFDLTQGPLLRVTLVRLGDADHVLLLTMHHIVSDAWSIGVLFQELSALYDSYSAGRESPLRPLPLQYGDFAVWQREWLRGDRLDSLLTYWKTALDGAPSVLELPSDRPRPPVQSFRGALQSFVVPVRVAKALKAFGQREGVTLFMTLLTAFFALLHRYTGQRDLVVGTPIANRNRAEIEGLIGFFVNSLVLRSRVPRNPTFRELLAEVRETTLRAYAHQDLPFEKLVEELHNERSLSHNPLFQVMFTLQTAPVGAAAAMPDLAESTDVTPPPVPGTAKFDLSLSLSDSEHGLVGGFEYSTDLFDNETIGRMVGHVQTLLDAVAADPTGRVWQLPLLSSEERRRIVVTWNATSADYPATSTLHELFAAQAERTPEWPAVELDGEVLTYRELNGRANQLAHELRQERIGPDARVGLCVERSIEMIVGLLAVLKAGGAYVPIDPEYPKPRISYLLSDAGPSVLLTQERLLDRLPSHTAKVLCLDRDWPRIAHQPRVDPPATAGPENLAYIIYTSGSTGHPKGVMVPHRGLANLWEAQRQICKLGSHDRVLQFVSLSFDISAWDLLLAFSAGATLVLGTRERLQPGTPLSRLIRDERVTVTTLLPSVYLTLDPADLRSVRLAISGGELCTPEVVARLAAGRQFVNGYGPTENTIAATLTAPWSDTNRRPPIGRPLPNVELYVLDRSLEPVPVGVHGELYIGGVALARGYVNRPDLTAASFVPDPFNAAPGRRLYRTGDVVRYLPDGHVEFLGRVDEQVKVRGYRIELGEVEAAMLEHPDVREAAAVVYQAGRERRLAAYVVSCGDEPVPASDLRAFLKDRLPEYMVPSTFTALAALPLTPNAKVDRKKLAALQADASRGDEHVAPRTPIEQVVANIWKDVVGVSRVGLHDNFFEIGGHSLSATQVVSRVRDTFRVDIPLRSLFEAPDVARFAQAVEEAQRSDAVVPAGIAAAARERQAPLSFAQQRLWIVDRLQPDNWAYNIPAAVRLRMPLQVPALERSINEIVRRHEALRTTFTAVDGEPRQVVAGDCPIDLPLIDLRHMAAGAREAEAQRLVAKEARRGFDLTRGPLLRATLVRVDDADHLLLLVLHHIVSDAWSMKLFFHELATLYDAFSSGRSSPLPPLPIQYADFAMWQRQMLQGERREALVDYWKRTLEGAPATMSLPVDHARPAAASVRGAVLQFAIDRAVTRSLKALSHREGATLFMTLQAAFIVLLHRWTGQDDLVIGTPIANRNRAEIEPLIGFFVNSLVLRSRVRTADAFSELLARVRDTTLSAYAHQDLPFETLVETLQPERSVGQNPLFQVMFSFQAAIEREFGWSGAALASEAHLAPVVNGSAKFDLSLAMLETGEDVVGGFEYNTDLFEAATIAALVEQFTGLLERLADQPERRIDAIDAELAALDSAHKQAREQRYRDVRRLKLGTTRRGVPIEP